jgi:hypothetical protein
LHLCSLPSDKCFGEDCARICREHPAVDQSTNPMVHAKGGGGGERVGRPPQTNALGGLVSEQNACNLGKSVESIFTVIPLP